MGRPSLLALIAHAEASSWPGKDDVNFAALRRGLPPRTRPVLTDELTHFLDAYLRDPEAVRFARQMGFDTTTALQNAPAVRLQKPQPSLQDRL